MRVSVHNGGVVYLWWRNFFKKDFRTHNDVKAELAKYNCRLCNPHSPFTTELEFDTYEDYTMFRFIFLCETFLD